GLLNLGETVTWRAKHFGVWQELTSKISEYHYPFYFTDIMLKGTFRSITHKHSFSVENGKTMMLDEFVYESPLGILGRLANVLVLTRYLRKFLEERNSMIKNFAESHEWKAFIA
ncbi:MAG: SRPBCC family protein, partial [Bacteroidia bacterium]|nr:SRPBCC family protein [Bacteroidia bacterium]